MHRRGEMTRCLGPTQPKRRGNSDADSGETVLVTLPTSGTGETSRKREATCAALTAGKGKGFLSRWTEQEKKEPRGRKSPPNQPGRGKEPREKAVLDRKPRETFEDITLPPMEEEHVYARRVRREKGLLTDGRKKDSRSKGARH